MRLVLVALLAVPALAAAQPGPDDPSPPGLVPPIAAPPPPSNVDQIDHDDAAADRAYGTSTALVVPAGRLDLSLRAGQGGFLASAAVGLGGGIEISGQLGGGADLGLLGGDVKIAVVRNRTWGFALTGGVHLVGSGDDSGGKLYSAGGVFSTVSDKAVLSFGAGLIGGSGDQTVGYANGSLVAGRGSVRPIVEVALVQSAAVGFLGARIGNGRIALDAGVAFAKDSGGGNGVGPLPLVGLTLRP